MSFSTQKDSHAQRILLCLGKSNDSESSSPEGDTRKQFAEEANSEFDKVGEDALKGLEEAGERIMENIESQMQAFEESQELNRQEIEKNEDQLARFEGQIEKDRNEGLFLKNLTERKPVDKAKAKDDAEKIKEITKEKARSEARRNIFSLF